MGNHRHLIRAILTCLLGVATFSACGPFSLHPSEGTAAIRGSHATSGTGHIWTKYATHRVMTSACSSTMSSLPPTVTRPSDTGIIRLKI